MVIRIQAWFEPCGHRLPMNHRRGEACAGFPDRGSYRMSSHASPLRPGRAAADVQQTQGLIAWIEQQIRGHEPRGTEGLRSLSQRPHSLGASVIPGIAGTDEITGGWRCRRRSQRSRRDHRVGAPLVGAHSVIADARAGNGLDGCHCGRCGTVGRPTLLYHADDDSGDVAGHDGGDDHIAGARRNDPTQ
jgi:hypothetical protein